MKPILTSMIQNQVRNKGWKWRKMQGNFQLLLSHFRLIIDSGHRLGWPFNYLRRLFLYKLGDETVYGSRKYGSFRVRTVTVAQTGFQTDASKPRCDWLALSQSCSDWLRASSSQNQFGSPQLETTIENSPRNITINLLLTSEIIGLALKRSFFCQNLIFVY